MPARILHFDHINNFRDLGGYESSYGVTSFGVVYRSGDLSQISENDKKKLSNLGIRSVIDLRTKEKAKESPDQLGENVQLILAPAYGDGRIPTSRSDMLDAYLEMIEEPFTAKAVWKAIAYAPKPTILHCGYGKDRTGVFSYLLLRLNGVSHEDANADYLTSYAYIEEGIQLSKAGKSDYPACIADPDVSFFRSFMETFLKRYGSIEAYLESVGINEDEIQLLKNLLGKQEKSCGAVVFYQDKVLVEHMDKGHYSIPKGHVESFDKDELDTARREIKEECQLDVDFIPGFEASTAYSPSAGIAKRVVFFLAEAKSDKVVPQKEEVQAIYFLSPRDALTTLSHDSDREIVNQAVNFYYKAKK